MRTADQIEEQNAAKQSLGSARKKSGRGSHPNSRANLKLHAYVKGQSGNPGGKPKHDVPAGIARAIFEQNEEAVYKAMAKSLLSGSAYVFKELSERGYGKLKETIEHSGDDLLLAALALGRKRIAGTPDGDDRNR